MIIKEFDLALLKYNHMKLTLKSASRAIYKLNNYSDVRKRLTFF